MPNMISLQNCHLLLLLTFAAPITALILRASESPRHELALAFWRSMGVNSETHINKLLSRGEKYQDPHFLRGHLDGIARITRQKTIKDAAKLVSRAPSLICYDLELLEFKVSLLDDIFVTDVVDRMIRRQVRIFNLREKIHIYCHSSSFMLAFTSMPRSN